VTSQWSRDAVNIDARRLVYTVYIVPLLGLCRFRCAQNPLETFLRNFPVDGEVATSRCNGIWEKIRHNRVEQTQRTFARANLLQTCHLYSHIVYIICLDFLLLTYVCCSNIFKSCLCYMKYRFLDFFRFCNVFRSFHTVLCWVHVCCIFIKPFLILICCGLVSDTTGKSTTSYGLAIQGKWCSGIWPLVSRTVCRPLCIYITFHAE